MKKRTYIDLCLVVNILSFLHNLLHFSKCKIDSFDWDPVLISVNINKVVMFWTQLKIDVNKVYYKMKTNLFYFISNNQNYLIKYKKITVKNIELKMNVISICRSLRKHLSWSLQLLVYFRQCDFMNIHIVRDWVSESCCRLYWWWW